MGFRRNKVFNLTNLFSLLFPIFLAAQGHQNKPQHYIWFDNSIGRTNSGLFKGVAYTNMYRVVNERHQFFNTSDFIPGSVIYDGQPYFEVPLKYDVYNDQLLVQNNTLANSPIMVFDSERVIDFSIGEHTFKRIGSVLEKGGALVGFAEILLKNDWLILYKKHTRKPFKRTDEQRMYYEFKNGYSYYLYHDNAYHKIKKGKDLNSLFPSYKKELKTIRDRHESLRKPEPEAYLKAVLTDLPEMMLNSSKEE